jgi:TldD protein
MDHPHPVDALSELPLDALTDAAFDRGRVAGCDHVVVRAHRLEQVHAAIHDREVDSVGREDALGLAVRVVHDGAWGFAATDGLGSDDVVELVDRAVALAKASKPAARQRVELVPEPAHGYVQHTSDYAIDPATVSLEAITNHLLGWTDVLMTAPSVTHAEALLQAVTETSWVATTDGTYALQQRVRIAPTVTVTAVTDDGFESLRTLAPCTGRGWEYALGTGWDWERELAELPELLAEKHMAPSVEPGHHDLLIDATNLWLTIHESVGHATELDRALGDEANYAGTSFATPDQLGRLRYGSTAMNIVADRTQRHGLATTGWDDEGVRAQEWSLVTDGVLTGFQTDRASARRQGLPSSNGCAYADGFEHAPIQRMANVNLLPDPQGPDLAGLVDALGDGYLVLGDGSWSIDMQRYNFQFTGQRFHRVRGGQIVGQVRDLVYQGRTPEFWGALEAVGGPSTYHVMGAFNCGKGQPGQVAPVSHGTPAAIFRGVNVLSAGDEGAS